MSEKLTNVKKMLQKRKCHQESLSFSYSMLCHMMHFNQLHACMQVEIFEIFEPKILKGERTTAIFFIAGFKDAGKNYKI